MIVKQKKYQVAVIGGGPAGIMAAGRAGELGADVVLLEGNSRLGVKLLITGNGRCNITNAEEDFFNLINAFGDEGRFLQKSMRYFNNFDVIEFFEKRGLKTKIENNGRVFPVSDKSADVLKCLVDYLKNSGVEILTDARVDYLVKSDKKIEKAILVDGREVVADYFVVCTGGKSYPATGSTGDAYRWLEELGHKIVVPRPGLVPIILKESWIGLLEGLSFRDVEISAYLNDKRHNSRRGEIIFTGRGVSGPAAIVISKEVGVLLSAKEKRVVSLEIDFFPDFFLPDFDRKLIACFQEGSGKIVANALEKFLPKRLAVLLVELSQINQDRKAGMISKEERKKILSNIKNLRVEVESLDDFNRAMITSGGVDLRDLNPSTMKSKIIDNLYIAGELLNLDGPTGGYNLQLCWSTGYAAGESVGKFE